MQINKPIERVSFSCFCAYGVERIETAAPKHASSLDTLARLHSQSGLRAFASMTHQSESALFNPLTRASLCQASEQARDEL